MEVIKSTPELTTPWHYCVILSLHYITKENRLITRHLKFGFGSSKISDSIRSFRSPKFVCDVIIVIFRYRKSLFECVNVSSWNVRYSETVYVILPQRFQCFFVRVKQWTRVRTGLLCLNTAYTVTCYRGSSYFIFILQSQESDGGAVQYIEEIHTRLGVFFASEFPGWVLLLTSFNLSLVRFHQTRIIIVKHFIKGRSNEGWMGVEPSTSR